MKLPLKITPCPIFDTNIEIRFDAILPAEAIFGVLYDKFKEEYKTFEKLPILQLPDELRLNDPNLVFQPHYKLKKDDFIIQIGPKMLSVGGTGEYVGWDAFSEEVKKIFSKAKDLNIFSSINRLGLRYINFFDFNIFEKIKLEISLDGKNLAQEQSLFRTSSRSGDFLNNLQITNKTNIAKNGKVMSGSILDIDISLDKAGPDIYDGLDGLIEDAHLEEKTLFYSLLCNDFLETLNPEY